MKTVITFFSLLAPTLVAASDFVLCSSGLNTQAYAYDYQPLSQGKGTIEFNYGALGHRGLTGRLNCVPGNPDTTQAKFKCEGKISGLDSISGLKIERSVLFYLHPEILTNQPIIAIAQVFTGPDNHTLAKGFPMLCERK